MDNLIRKVEESTTNPDYLIFCPACGCSHSIWVYKRNKISGGIWKFNEDFTNPTFFPSILIDEFHKTRCHFWIENGKIKYAKDCDHAFAGSIINMVKF